MAANTMGLAARPVRIPITNIYMGGDYTGIVAVGSQKKPANVILDTGSSTLALDGNFYNPSDDPSAKLTNIIQDVTYGSGNWIGAVVQTDVSMGGIHVPAANLAVAYDESQSMFGQANGILGLAYQKLNSAFTMPSTTWPPAYYYNQIQQGRVTYLTPYFDQLEQSGLTANKFAFYTKRSLVSNSTADPATDPLNGGFLILGGGEESVDLYDSSNPFQAVRVLDDEWYNTNLKAIIVGNSDPIQVLPPTKGSGNLTNSIIDSGTNSILLDQTLFDTVANHFSTGNSRDLVQAMRAGYIPNSSLHLQKWPNITFVLDGDPNDVKLTVKPGDYWQVDSPERGYASSVLLGDNGQLKGESILGLPLMNGYFTIFDRSVDKLGVIKFAPRL